MLWPKPEDLKKDESTLREEITKTKSNFNKINRECELGGRVQEAQKSHLKRRGAELRLALAIKLEKTPRQPSLYSRG